MPLSAMDAGALAIDIGLPPGLVALEPSVDNKHMGPLAASQRPHDPLPLESGRVHQPISWPGRAYQPMSQPMARHVAAQSTPPPRVSAPPEWELPVPSSLLSVAKTAAVPVTLIMKNIPSRCTSNDLLDAIEAAGFQGTFDFLYLPLKPQKFTQNRGYAFVGLHDRWQASAFCELLSGARVAKTSAKEVWLEEAVEHRTIEEVQVCTKTEVVNTKFGAVLVLQGTKSQIATASASTKPIRL